jgi:ATP-dependent DNA helicase RecG
MDPRPLPAFGGSAPLSDAELLSAPLRSLPRPSRLEAPLVVTPARAAKGAAALGLHTVGDLVEHLPFRHDDRREARPVAALTPGTDATVVVTVRSIRARPTRRRMQIVEATVHDETGPLKAVWFNQPWLVGRLPAGTRVVLHGRYEGRSRFRVSEYELVDAATQGGTHSVGLVPVYPASEGIPPARIRELAWSVRGAERDTVETLPAAVRVAECLPDRPAALAAVHFPTEPEDEATGRRRLAFEELLTVQLLFMRRRARRAGLQAAAALDEPPSLTQRWMAQSLPFEPTRDQQAAIDAVSADLAREHPMQRLLMGEVGSGKTVVALWAMLRALEHGMQAALMAPTETLAEQHFATIQALMPGESVPFALLTGSTPAGRRADTLAKLASGELGMVVGTHALIEPTVRFDRLSVAVVDEQHRFGVRQRTALDAKGAGGLTPHVLHLTATPIPRTLALVGYGDLDFTILRELPAGRLPVATHVASGERARARAYERIREELRAGRQAFVVCPLVEESDALQARAATAEFERLAKGEFKDFRVVLLHGQMRPREKQAAMASFAAGAADVLVATSVIEVGIDVPNATVMLVENAERYGISQLHQLRGRVGRGGHPSVCILFGPGDSPRLRALAEHADGFALAAIDLELRKEGELVGTRQSGLGQFRVARLPEDRDLLERARIHAEAMVAADAELTQPEHALLADALLAVGGSDGAADAELAPLPA